MCCQQPFFWSIRKTKVWYLDNGLEEKTKAEIKPIKENGIPVQTPEYIISAPSMKRKYKLYKMKAKIKNM